MPLLLQLLNLRAILHLLLLQLLLLPLTHFHQLVIPHLQLLTFPLAPLILLLSIRQTFRQVLVVLFQRNARSRQLQMLRLKVVVLRGKLDILSLHSVELVLQTFDRLKQMRILVTRLLLRLLRLFHDFRKVVPHVRRQVPLLFPFLAPLA